jgi:hypothetical protein
MTATTKLSNLRLNPNSLRRMYKTNILIELHTVTEHIAWKKIMKVFLYAALSDVYSTLYVRSIYSCVLFYYLPLLIERTYNTSLKSTLFESHRKHGYFKVNNWNSTSARA